MAWVKMESRYPRHPKIMAAGPDAMALDIGGMGYSRDYNTCGFVPDAALTTISCAKNPKASAKRLVAVGRWERDDERGGYWVHDFDEYNPADEQKQRSEKASKAAKARWGKGQETSPEHAPTDAMVDAWSTTDTDAPSIAQALLNPCEPDAMRAGVPADPSAAARPRPHPTPPLTKSSPTTHVGFEPRHGTDSLIHAACDLLARRELAARQADHERGVFGATAILSPQGWRKTRCDTLIVEHSETMSRVLAGFVDGVVTTPYELLVEWERAVKTSKQIPGARSWGALRAQNGIDRADVEAHAVAQWPDSPEAQTAAMDAYDATATPAAKTRLEVVQ